jgi:tetratricopeptide (TPR) repeat protein
MEQFRRHYKEAIEYAERAVTISPNDANALADLGFFLVWNDNPEAGIKYFTKSIMLDPLHRGAMGLGLAYFSMKDYEKTLKHIDIGITDNPERTPLLAFYAAAHAFIGNETEANLTKMATSFILFQSMDLFFPYISENIGWKVIRGVINTKIDLKALSIVMIFSITQ